MTRNIQFLCPAATPSLVFECRGRHFSLLIAWHAGSRSTQLLAQQWPDSCCMPPVRPHLPQALTACQAGAGGVLPEAMTFRAATQQLVAYLLTLHLPHMRTCLAAVPHTSSQRTGSASSSSSSRHVPGAKAGPDSMEDFLWWAEGRSSSSRSGSRSSVMLDSAVGVLHELLGLAQHEDQLLTGTDWAAGAVMEVVREVRVGGCGCEGGMVLASSAMG